MSTLQFPKNPSINDEYDWEGFKYVYDGQKWKTIGVGYNPVNDLKDKLEPRIDELEDDVTQLQSGNSSLVQAVNSLNVRVTAEEKDTKDWEVFTAELLAQAGIVDDGQPDELGNSQRVDAISKICGRVFASVDAMVAFDDLVAGQRYSTGGITWGYKGFSDGSIADFVVLSEGDARDFGAKKDGISDDKTPLISTYAESNGGDFSRVSSSVLVQSSDVLSRGARVVGDSFSGFTLDFTSPTIANTSTTSKAFTFTNSVSVADAAGIEQGNVVKIKSTVAWPFWTDCYYGHTAIVESVSGNTITFEQPFMLSIESGATVTVYNGGTLILDRHTIKNDASLAGVNSNCIRVTGYGHVEIENAVLENGQSKGLFLAYCVNARVYGGIYKGSNATSTGYGIQAWGCNEVGISGVVGHGNRRLVDFSGDIPTIAGSIRDFKVHGGGKQENGLAYSPIGGVENFGVGSHGGALSMQISDGYIANVSTGINIRSPKTVIKDVHFDGAIVGQLIKLADGSDVFIDGVTYRPFAAGFTQDTVNTQQSLLPSNFLLIDSAFASKGGKVKVQNADVHIQDSFIRTSAPVVGRIELKQNNCKFDLDGGGTAKWLRGDFNDVSIDGKTVENTVGTRVLIGATATTLPDGMIDQEEHYKQTVADGDAKGVQLNTSSTQVKVEVLDRASPDVRGIVLIRQGSTTLRDFGTSNLISAASGVLNAGDGVDLNLTMSLQDGVLYLANRTGASLTLSLCVQGAE